MSIEDGVVAKLLLTDVAVDKRHPAIIFHAVVKSLVQVDHYNLVVSLSDSIRDFL